MSKNNQDPTFHIIDMPPMVASTLVPNSDDWLKALRGVNRSQAQLSTETIQDCVRLHGHRKCCCVCGDTVNTLHVASQRESPLNALMCEECIMIQSHMHQVHWWHMRPLTQEEDDYLMAEAGRKLQA